jgi:serine/threonine protein kinase
MWSLGVTFFAILFNTLPFYEELLIKLFELIENGKYSFPKNTKREFEIYMPIIEKLLIVDSKKRPSAKELLDLL